MKIRTRARCVLALAFALVGCSKEQRDQLAETVGKAKEQVSSKAAEVTSKASETVSAAKETVVADGEASFKIDKDLSFSASYVNLVTVKGRGSVLHLRSYSDSKGEAFPAYFFQSNTNSASLNALSGQSLTGTLFVKRDKAEATMLSMPDQAVTVSLDSIAEGKLKGRITSGKLSSVKGETFPVTGTFEAMIEGGLE